MNSRPDWTHVRLRKRTLARLRAYGLDLMALADMGRLDLPIDERNRRNEPSIDLIIVRLLDTVRRHRRRARKQRGG